MKCPSLKRRFSKIHRTRVAWHWTYTLPGLDGIPLYVRWRGTASNSVEAAEALNAARAQGRR